MGLSGDGASPVSYECDWMVANTGLLRLVGVEMFVIICEVGFSY